MDIEQLAREAGMESALNQGSGSCVFSPGCNGVTQEHIEHFARLVAERCAGICEDYPSRDPAEDGSGYWAADECANAIRQEFGL